MGELTFEKYQKEVEKIQKGRKQINDPYDNDLPSGAFPYIYDMFLVINIQETLNEGLETKEDLIDKKLYELHKKYKKTFTNQVQTGLAGRLDGFEFRIYSNDHDMHFHIIHRGKGVNARYSFPEIKLMSYKSYKNHYY